MLVTHRALLATLGYVAALFAAAWELELWTDPLPDEITLAALALAHLGAGALADRWRIVAASAAVAAAAALAGEGLEVFLAIVFGVPIAGVLLALGVGAGKLARRRARGDERQLIRVLAAVLATCALAPAAFAAFDELRPPVDDTPDDPLVLDPVRGTYRGIALGDRERALVRRVGRPERRGSNEPAEPLGEDYYEVGGPTTHDIPPGDEETLRYRELSVFLVRGRVYGWVTTSERAETPEGIGVGDSRALVQERYPDADCYIGNEGTEYVTFPVCEVELCSGRRLVFGGDRIKSVWLIAETRAALRPCARRGERRRR
jgi:hypothetical protein